ncbi:MAG: hypothetical protein EOP84_06020, partial [Verrucomicrobiaceae bacterium]
MFAPDLRTSTTLLAMMMLTPASAQEVFLRTGGSGDWSEAGKWSTGTVPNSAMASVTIDGNPSISSSLTATYNNPSSGFAILMGRLQVDSGDQIHFPVNKTPALIPGGFVGAGTISNNGIIQIPGGFTWGDGSGTAAVTLGGSGKMMMGSPTANASFEDRAANTGTSPLVNQSTIEGAWNFGSYNSSWPNLQNQSLLHANIPGTASNLVLANASTNTGTLKASNGARLQFIQGSWNNTGGLITADGAGSVVQHSRDLITGGAFSTTNGGEIWLTDQPRWKDVTSTGTVEIRRPLSGGAPGGLQVISSLTNSGTIRINEGSSIGIGETGTAETISLSGGGNILLNAPLNYEIGSPLLGAVNFAGHRLFNVDNTISGSGAIDVYYDKRMHITNRGLFVANLPGKTLGMYMFGLNNENGGIL